MHQEQPLLGHVSVDLCRLQAGVTEEFLDDSQIGSIVQKMSGEAMTQGVGVEGLGGAVIDDPPGVAGREPPAPPVEEQGGGRGPRGAQGGAAELHTIRDPKRALLLDARGTTLYDVATQGDACMLDVARHDLLHLRVEFS